MGMWAKMECGQKWNVAKNGMWQKMDLILELLHFILDCLEVLNNLVSVINIHILLFT